MASLPLTQTRMRRALLYEHIDHLPSQIDYLVGAGQNQAVHFGLLVEQLPDPQAPQLLDSVAQPLALQDAGLIIAPSATMMIGIPIENIDALPAAFCRPGAGS